MFRGHVKPLEGPKIEIDSNYGGLGAHYINTLYQNLNRVHQVDTVTGVTETNGSVRTRAIQIAISLQHLGIVDNDIILICSRCHADQTIVILAALFIGCIVAPLDPELQHKDCMDLVKQLKPKICFCDLRALKQIERVVQETGMSSQLVHFGDQQNYAVAFRKLIQNKPSQNFQPVFIESPSKKVAFILPTQGTSGAVKLVCLSHQFIYSQTQIFMQAMKDPVKVLSYFPLTWVMQVTLVCMCFGDPVVRILTGGFAERSTCKFIQDLKIDYAFLTTDLALKLIEHVAVRDFNLSCLKCIFIGNEMTTIQDIKRLITRLPKVKFTQMYCTTETGIVTACAPSDYDESLDKIGTLGKLVQNVKARIVDVRTREDLGPECRGELLVGGDNLMLGYFKNMGLTKSSMESDYFKTGDVGRYDCSGWLFIEGRINDIIHYKGAKVLPSEIEEVLLMHPFVRDAAVIGNEKQLIACVIVKTEASLDENKLLTFISDRLPPHKMPSKIVFMDSFPTTSVGKVKKDVLRDQYLKVHIQTEREL